MSKKIIILLSLLLIFSIVYLSCRQRSWSDSSGKTPTAPFEITTSESSITFIEGLPEEKSFKLINSYPKTATIRTITCPNNFTTKSKSNDEILGNSSIEVKISYDGQKTNNGIVVVNIAGVNLKVETIMKKPSWKPEEWSICNNDLRTRTVNCQRADGVKLDESYCTETKPDTSKICTVSWVADSWSVCTNDKRTRTVTCQNEENKVIDDSYCKETKLDTTKTCTTSWIPSAWSACTNDKRTRTVTCQNEENKIIDNSYCKETKPETEGNCNYTNSIGMEFVLVEAGTFQMGSNDGESDEKPIHTVSITKDFYIGKYEVTQGQWKAVMGSNPSSFSSCGDNCPVEKVSWNDAQSFITKLNEKEGTNKYRLSTEAEWEYSARGSKKSLGYTYSGSNIVGDVAWYGSNSSSKTHQVGTKSPNELGIYDMSGNVWEWVGDYYGSYSSAAVSDPYVSSGTYCVLRGGSWSNLAFDVRVAGRIGDYPPDLRSGHVGFRVAKTQYSWITGSWDSCTNNKLTRTVACKNIDGQEVADSLCKETKPTTEQDCLKNSIGMEFVLVEAGTFQMGSNDGESDEKPVHTVNITKDFYIGKYEVTQGQWKAVMGTNPSESSSCGEDCPVESVSWNDAQTFITKLNEKEGTNKYRFPTEAEWEYAGRGGNKSKGYTYSGSNTVGDVAWYSSNSSNKTHPVGTKQANELEIYDMSGNVWEWVQDYYDSSWYSKSSQNNPVNTNLDTYFVMRGGSLNGHAGYVRVANRPDNYPNIRYYNVGFRVTRAF